MSTLNRKEDTMNIYILEGVIEYDARDIIGVYTMEEEIPSIESLHNRYSSYDYFTVAVYKANKSHYDGGFSGHIMKEDKRVYELKKREKRKAQWGPSL